METCSKGMKYDVVQWMKKYFEVGLVILRESEKFVKKVYVSKI